MSDLILNKDSQLSKNLVQLVEHRKAIISNPVVQEKLNTHEARIVKSGLYTPIKAIPEKELVKLMADQLKMLARDVGIQSWDSSEMQYDYTRAFQFIRDYYSELTLQELKTAFEMLLTSQLDEYLPKRDGEPDRNHYQKFSLDYITKVLNAFREKKNKVWGKAAALVPEKTATVSEQEKETYRKSFIDRIVDKHNQYKDSGIWIDFHWPLQALNMLCELGYDNKIDLPTLAHWKKGKSMVLNDQNIDAFKKNYILSLWAQQMGEETTLSRANYVCWNEQIKTIFNGVEKSQLKDTNQ